MPFFVVGILMIATVPLHIYCMPPIRGILINFNILFLIYSNTYLTLSNLIQMMPKHHKPLEADRKVL